MTQDRCERYTARMSHGRKSFTVEFIDFPRRPVLAVG